MNTDRIGVAISTHNRRDILDGSLKMWRELMPDNSTLVVVDDASDEPVRWAIRNPQRMGIAVTKNRGIEALMDAGCEHLFLADDDVFPISRDWWQPYVDSPEPHLSYQWSKPGRSSKWSIKHNDGTHFAIGFPRGVMLYAQRKVIDIVGGMDPAYGAWGGEHVDWQHRIHQAGLTTWPFADVCGSDELWFAHDKERGNTVGSSLPFTERHRLAKMNGALWEKKSSTWPFVPYRPGEGTQEFDLGPSLGSDMLSTLAHVLSLHPSGTAMEFGVGSGRSLALIADKMPVIGFDSFQGLPQRWRDGFPRGMFACDPPEIPNSTIMVGLFKDTLPKVRWPQYVGLVHFDADLYTSTRDALAHVGPHLRPGTYVVFDEYHGYPGFERHEMKAWKQFAARTGIGWTVVGHGPEQWAIRII